MNWQILHNYLEGACSEEEFTKLAQWLQQSEANEDFFKTFIEQADSSEDPDFEANAQEAWKAFKKEYEVSSSTVDKKSGSLASNTSTKSFKEVNRNRHKSRKSGLYWAAVTAVLAILVSTIWLMQGYVKKTNNVQFSKDALQKITTLKGQQTQLTLADSTHVVLDAASTLKIPTNYGAHSRRIYLKGEAFFKVKHDPDHPFTVITNHRYIQDVGTHFNIKAYDSTRAEVAVSEGKVAIGSIKNKYAAHLDKPETQLSANMVGILEAGQVPTIKYVNDLNEYIGWTQKKLVFHRTALPDVAKRLERWFGVTVKIKGADLDKRTLTATYDDLPLGDVLKVMSLSMDISYGRHKDTIVFKKKR